jgi:hypothetical protein
LVNLLPTGGLVRGEPPIQAEGPGPRDGQEHQRRPKQRQVAHEGAYLNYLLHAFERPEVVHD